MLKYNQCEQKPKTSMTYILGARILPCHRRNAEARSQARQRQAHHLQSLRPRRQRRFLSGAAHQALILLSYEVDSLRALAGRRHVARLS